MSVTSPHYSECSNYSNRITESVYSSSKMRWRNGHLWIKCCWNSGRQNHFEHL